MRVFGATASAALLSLALVGCGDDSPQAGSLAEASDTKTADAGATEEPTPAEEPTTEEPSPDETAEDEGRVTRDGDDVDDKKSAAAEAFVADFLKAYDQAALTGDVSTVQKMFTDECARRVPHRSVRQGPAARGCSAHRAGVLDHGRGIRGHHDSSPTGA